MVLFSSFNHFNIFVLFAYLGLVSGLTFFLVYDFASFVKIKNKTFIDIQKKTALKIKELSTKGTSIVEKATVFEEKRQSKKRTKLLLEKKSKQQKKLLKHKDLKEENLEPQEELKKQKQEIKKQRKEQKQQKRQQKKIQSKQKKQRIKKIFLKVLSKIKVGIKRAQNVLLTGFCVVVLAGVVLGSFYANVILNYGYLRFVFIGVWIVFFFLGGHMLKKVAKLVANFYNKISKQKAEIKARKNLSKE